MSIEQKRFLNLEKFKWKCADDLGIMLSDVSDNKYANWLGIKGAYYSHLKTGYKKMSQKYANKLELRIGLDAGTLDNLHIEDNLFSDFMLECFNAVRTYTINNNINITPEQETRACKTIYMNGKSNGLKIDLDLLKNVMSIF
jgi:hypothetical protein